MRIPLLCLGALLMVIDPLTAQNIIAIDAVKDNTLFEDAAGSVSNGIGANMFVGRNNQGSLRRAVIAFDVAGSVPAGAVIDSVSLGLYMDQTTSGPHTISVHRATSEWGEGTSSSGGGTGAPSTTGDATWIHTFYDTMVWTFAGGDFEALASGSQSVDGPGPYQFSSPGLAADVQDWLDTPAGDFGWVLVGNETVNQSAKRFATRENATTANRPLLTVYWSGPVSVSEDGTPHPSRFALQANYPNPFNPTTTIRYSLAERGSVTLTIHTVTGQTVATLVDAVREAGTQDATWNADGMASGMYLYTLRSGRLLQTRSMILLK